MNIEVERICQAGDYLGYLSLESIERAKSGHPGLPLGMAKAAVLLFRYLLKFDPSEPRWPNRDRFVLSAGHGSMLLYSLLHLSGYPLTLDDLAHFRQWGSRTPGHPEYEPDMGIETTTGPLGQGFANAVGLALEGKMMAARFNREGFPLFDHMVYTLMGDGCNMEGISYEAASLAGHFGLDNLLAIYDSNRITIDGSTEIAFTEDVGKRYMAMGWIVDHCDGCQIETVARKLRRLRNVRGKPKLLIVHTVIGDGLEKKRGTSKIHGSPAGVEEIAYFTLHSTVRALFEMHYGREQTDSAEKMAALLKRRFEERAPLLASTEVTDFMRQAVTANRRLRKRWEKLLKTYPTAFPGESRELSRFLHYSPVHGLRDRLLQYREEKADSTRNMAGRVLNLCAGEIPQIVGGSADLVESTQATVKSSSYVRRGDFSGRNIAFGVREHAMGSIGNGLALSRTLIPFTSTFFSFLDYMKPSVRLASMMRLNHLFIFTHDSIFLGEDGPTHQPIEQLDSLRIIPNLYTFRPANDVETSFSFLFFLERMSGPAAIVCTRQKIGEECMGLGRERSLLYDDFQKGAYVFYETAAARTPDLVIGASGSELGLALRTAHLLEERDDLAVRVISIPCLELFAESGREHRDRLLPGPMVPFVLIEAASHRAVRVFFQPNLLLVDIERFGASAPAGELAAAFGFTPEAVYARIRSECLLKGS